MTKASSNEQRPATMRAVQRRLGYHETVLRRIHPAACREIVTQYKAYVQQRKEARLLQLQEEITRVALQLRAQGIAPTQKRIAPYLSHSGILRDPSIRKHLRAVCHAEQT